MAPVSFKKASQKAQMYQEDKTPSYLGRKIVGAIIGILAGYAWYLLVKGAYSSLLP